MTIPEDLGIIGRERALIDALARLVQGAVNRRHDYTPLRETRRGTVFEVAIRDPDDEPTGRVARISIELVGANEKNLSY